MAGARDEGAAARNRQVARRGVRFAAAVATALAVGFAPPAVAAVGQVDAQQTGTDGFFGLVVGGYNFTGVAQTFTPTRSGLLDRVDLFVSSELRATLGLKAEIWPTDGGGAPIGPALASTLVPPGGVSSGHPRLGCGPVRDAGARDGGCPLRDRGLYGRHRALPVAGIGGRPVRRWLLLPVPLPTTGFLGSRHRSGSGIPDVSRRNTRQ